MHTHNNIPITLIIYMYMYMHLYLHVYPHNVHVIILLSCIYVHVYPHTLYHVYVHVHVHLYPSIYTLTRVHVHTIPWPNNTLINETTKNSSWNDFNLSHLTLFPNILVDKVLLVVAMEMEPPPSLDKAFFFDVDFPLFVDDSFRFLDFLGFDLATFVWMAKWN